MNLILLERHEVDDHGETVLADHRADHVREVLRATVGQRLRVGLVDGPLGHATVRSADSSAVRLACTFEEESPPIPPIDLLLALPRPKVMKRLWAQLAALGVGRILLTNADRVERNYFDTHVLDPAFYRPLLLEGLQQAQDTRVPLVSIHKRFKPLVEDEIDTLYPAWLRLVAQPGDAHDVSEAVPRFGPEAWPMSQLHTRELPPVFQRPVPEPRLLLAVGPEGGWVPFELELLRAHGFHTVGLSSRTLRVDTAAIALLSLAHQAMAEWTRHLARMLPRE